MSSTQSETNEQQQQNWLTTRVELPEGQERFRGVVKGFKKTYGFAVVVSEGEHSGKDIMINHANIMTSKECYKTLHRGEHIEFGIEVLEDGRIQALNVSGPDGLSLMCETNPRHVQRRYTVQGRGRGFYRGRGRGGNGRGNGRGGRGGRGASSTVTKRVDDVVEE